MTQQLFAPQLDALIQHAQGLPAVVGEDSQAALLRLFDQLHEIAACGEDERRELWLTAERGAIEDFGDYEEYLDEGDVETYEEFETLWRDYYPEPLKWYPLTTMVYRDNYSVFLDHKLVLQIASGEQEEFDYDKSELLDWLATAVEACIAAVKSGTYNGFVEENLPARKRVGKILREDYWSVYPEEKAAYLEHITPEDIRDFTVRMQSQSSDVPSTRLPEMTAGLFFDCCRLGYEANGYEGAGQLSPRELYRANADGRHDGLLDLPKDSANAFEDWTDNGFKGGHPWEVCREGNSTHISLFVRRDDNGWWLELAGSSYGRSVETIKFYLALVRNGLPASLYNGSALAAMVTGQDYIGIVPEGIIPCYCDDWFPREDKFLQFMNLPWENADTVAQAAEWYPLDGVMLTANP